MGLQTDLSLQDGVDTVSTNHKVSFIGRSIREGQLHAIICFPGSRQAVTKMECAFWLRVGEQFLKFGAMHIVSLLGAG
jgi:hypothetical protein